MRSALTGADRRRPVDSRRYRRQRNTRRIDDVDHGRLLSKRSACLGTCFSSDATACRRTSTGSGAAAVTRAAVVSSTSSSCNSSWAISRSIFSDERPNCCRRSHASWAFRCSMRPSRSTNAERCFSTSWRSSSAVSGRPSASSTPHDSPSSSPEKQDLLVRVVVPHQLARSGRQVRSGRRQSIPSSSIDSCASLSVTVVPVEACGHTKCPRSSRLLNRQ